MTRVLQKHGNSMALVFDKTMLDLLGVGEDGKLEVEISNGRMSISATNYGVGEEKLHSVLESFQPEYADAFKVLANR